MATIKTFNQYVEEIHRSAARKHDIALAEAKRELPAENFHSEWRDYVVNMFNAGHNIPTRLWRSLDEGLQYRVLRTPRALQDDSLTHKLREKEARNV